MLRFEDQVAVISGAADGLGKAIAHRLAAEGCRLALLDINKEMLNATVNEFKEKGFAVEGYKADISLQNAVQETMQQAEERFGKIDIMVNSAGIIGPTSVPITDYPVEEYDKVYTINLRGSF